MKVLRVVILLSILFLLLISCKRNSVEPGTPEQNYPPGRRDYTWMADTINNPFLDFVNIWGSDTSNVWIAGFMMSNGLYKYDGKKWNLDNRVYISDPFSVWGYENSVWIGNDQGCIWKFMSNNNSYSQEVQSFIVDGNLVRFGAMAGTTEKEIYAVGCNHTPNPIIVKYNGLQWTLDKKLSDLGAFDQIIYSPKNDKYYLILDLNDYSSQILEYDRTSLKKIYEYPPSNSGPTLSVIDGYAYFVIGQKIYRYYGGNMELILEVNDPNFGGAVWGRNRNDILIRMQDGLAHYNGTDWIYLFKVTEPTWLEPHSAIFDKDVFIPAKIQRTGYPIVYHGKLK